MQHKGGGNPKVVLRTTQTGRESGAWVIGQLEGKQRLRIQLPQDHLLGFLQILLESDTTFRIESHRGRMIVGTAIPIELVDTHEDVGPVIVVPLRKELSTP